MEKRSYQTKTRGEILSFLKASRERTVNVPEILAFLDEKGIRVSESTVYRYLSRLSEDGEIMKYTAEKGKNATFQYTGKDTLCSNHLHLQCTDCGHLIHLDCHFMHELSHHLLEGHGFSLKCEGNILYGRCDKCRKK